MPSTTKSTPKAPARQPSRFAHPFFTTPAPSTSVPVSGASARMLDHITSTLGPVPPGRGDGTWALADIIGAQSVADIAATGKITFHVAGDTGVPEGDHETQQVIVAEAMTKDYDPKNPAHCPACFVHLGDVIYGVPANAYLSEFYRPYMHYPGKIIAIPGNHDGETAAKLQAFQDNFCTTKAVVPAVAGSIYRETMTQPGVYWCLDAPFVQIIGLYSNNAENPGAISGGAAGTAQKTWLVKTLKALKAQRASGAKKALFFATHHPPYSSGGHSGSAQMLADIDDACTQAGLWPNAFFSGHAHSIQRYERAVTIGGQKTVIPYVVSGCGGHGGQIVAKAPGPQGDNPQFVFSYKGWGYTTVAITAKDFTITSFSVVDTVVKSIDTKTYPL